jgi:hypothetical protein
MTDADAALDPVIRRRHGGLVALGLLLILIGIIGVVSVLFPLLASFDSIVQYMVTTDQVRSRQELPRVPTPEFITSAIVFLCLSAITIWAGVASCLAVRWARPFVMILCGYTIAYALFAFVAATLNLPHLLELAESSHERNWLFPTSDIVTQLFWIREAAMLFAAVVLPFFLLRYFASSATELTLAALDPKKRWTDQVPVPVLAWSLLCALSSISILMTIQHPFLPLFIAPLTNVPGIIILSILAILLAWGAWLCYRLDRLGWILTSLLISAMHLGTFFYFYNGGSPASVLNDPNTQLPIYRQPAAPSQSFLTIMAGVEAAIVMGFGAYTSTYFLDIRWRVAAFPRRKELPVAPTQRLR